MLTPRVAKTLPGVFGGCEKDPEAPELANALAYRTIRSVGPLVIHIQVSPGRGWLVDDSAKKMLHFLPSCATHLHYFFGHICLTYLVYVRLRSSSRDGGQYCMQPARQRNYP